LRVYDARRLAAVGLDTAIVMSLAIEGGIEDVRGAVDDDDLPSAFESAVEVLSSLAMMRHLLDGGLRSFGLRRLALLGATDDEVLAVIAALPPAIDATPEVVEELLARAQREAADIRAAMPFDIPALRKPDGLFKGLRVAKSLEALRARVGVPPFDWTLIGEPHGERDPRSSAD